MGSIDSASLIAAEKAESREERGDREMMSLCQKGLPIMVETCVPYCTHDLPYLLHLILPRGGIILYLSFHRRN